MKLIAIVGSGSNSGKTTLVCRILRAIPGLGAVKFSPRDEESWVEWGPGAPGKDTALFAAAGAARVVRIVGRRECAAETWRRCSAEFAGLSGVAVEGTGALECAGEKFTIFVCGPCETSGRPERDEKLLCAADAVVVANSPGNNRMPVPPIESSHSTPDSARHPGMYVGNSEVQMGMLIERLRSFLSTKD